MSAKSDNELALFKAFLQLCPDFAGAEFAGDPKQPASESDFPDIHGRTASGQTVGVEITQWLNAELMEQGLR